MLKLMFVLLPGKRNFKVDVTYDILTTTVLQHRTGYEVQVDLQFHCIDNPIENLCHNRVTCSIQKKQVIDMRFHLNLTPR